MKKNHLIIFLSVLTLTLMAPSCGREDDSDPEAVEYHEYETVPFSLTATIVPTDDEVEGIDLKKSFAEGDAIVVTNYTVLAEPAVLVCNDCAGKQTAVFSGELKVMSHASLTDSTRFAAALKKSSATDTLYNNGKLFSDVKVISSLSEGLDRYSCWISDGFAYSANGSTASLNQRTAFVNISLLYGGAKINLSHGHSQCELTLNGSTMLAVPFGTRMESQAIHLDEAFGQEGKSIYDVEGAGAPENCLTGIFSVDKDKQVFFSKGNLLCRPMDGFMRFAYEQTQIEFYVDFEVGENYSELTGEYDYFDLWGWGTWQEGYNPVLTSTDYYMYEYPMDDDELMGDCAFGKEWHVLSLSEWFYLLYTRGDAENKFGWAIIDSFYQGLVILPDYFDLPDGLEFESGETSVNEYQEEDWKLMEDAGAVFLPLAGTRCGDIVSVGHGSGMYWTTSQWGLHASIGFLLSFGDVVDFDYQDPFIGGCVRLVRYCSEK